LFIHLTNPSLIKEQMEFASLVDDPLGVLDYVVGGICGGGARTIALL
jgi:hypothetical protein